MTVNKISNKKLGILVVLMTLTSRAILVEL